LGSVSDLDLDPCGSLLKWLPWIRIHNGNTDPDPDPGQSKWRQKSKTNPRFQNNYFFKFLYEKPWIRIRIDIKCCIRICIEIKKDLKHCIMASTPEL